MCTTTPVLNVDELGVNSEITWKELYPLLRASVRKLVYSFHVSSWRGQEADLIEDIVQETARRLVERSRKALAGEATPISSLKQMMLMIAQNYCKDLWRRDHRLLHMLPYDYTPEVRVGSAEYVHPLDAVTENVYQEWLFTLIAHEVVDFPDKQRTVLLIDLANRMAFDEQPTPLQQAFLEKGIQLQQYRQPLPADPQERSRHTSLLNHAYKRVARLPCVQQYIVAGPEGNACN